jgi:hypothetical protein
VCVCDSGVVVVRDNVDMLADTMPPDSRVCCVDGDRSPTELSYELPRDNTSPSLLPVTVFDLFINALFFTPLKLFIYLFKYFNDTNTHTQVGFTAVSHEWVNLHPWLAVFSSIEMDK